MHFSSSFKKRINKCIHLFRNLQYKVMKVSNLKFIMFIQHLFNMFKENICYNQKFLLHKFRVKVVIKYTHNKSIFIQILSSGMNGFWYDVNWVLRYLFWWCTWCKGWLTIWLTWLTKMKCGKNISEAMIMITDCYHGYVMNEHDEARLKDITVEL